MRCMKKKKERKLTLHFNTETMNALVESGFITPQQKMINEDSISLEMDPIVAKYCEDLIKNNPKMKILLLSQTFMLQTGKFFMNPISEKRSVPIHPSMDDGWSGYT